MDTKTAERIRTLFLVIAAFATLGFGYKYTTQATGIIDYVVFSIAFSLGFVVAGFMTVIIAKKGGRA